MKILTACANGSGTSLMLLRTVKKTMEKLGYQITQADHTSISEAKGIARNYDVVFTSIPFIKMFDEVKKRGGEVIGIKNVISAKEVEDKINASDIPAKFKKD
ncbi:MULTISPECIES: PTS sugar transporter subunit IIB [Lactobacillus]|uniref:PTS sugar transporter subunit IIB n=1 Tax=Lactobacillus TaxID=1578 RepID=UPI001C699E58|nr:MULTISPECIES: PTS sugar transporter subunit IIB [Lactobacillus]MCX8721792.1 PTS sugar transporter subunit IIB [Lactobacillus sp. B4010]MCX8723577.1 PTS sugar transporter subunit IIB [Lactobacillus sp. B4005]MCX8731770.1 PTS sugar transporter subunit IIB [Lactobacillus sp. B4015]MCX8733956.1 PTS sugar transporter subunit IIB [Lactobacillus sp. B4012]QYN55889.1 PTS sugar transporter subunit IIB [Lactobacillus panisapium]